MEGGHHTSARGDVALEEPTGLVLQAQTSRPERIARSEVRRAARHAAPDAIRVAKPPEGSAVAREASDLADARAYTWVRTDELARLLELGDIAAASAVIDDLIRVEEAIRLVIDTVAVSPNWRGLEDELSSASDLIIDSLRAQRALPEGPSRLAGVRTGQSVWIRAWRPFLLVVTSG
jgi:hypothetical protein